MNKFHVSRKKKTEKEAKSDWGGVSKDVHDAVLSHLTEEFEVAARNNKHVVDDFNTFYNMLHSVREGKVNDWESDISLPEFTSRLLTQVGNFVAQYFSSTDYVEADIDSDDPRDIMEAKAATRLLNTILKDQDNHYYHKIVRLVMFIFSCGYGIIKGGWRQRVTKQLSHYEQKTEYVTDDLTGDYLAEDGSPFADPTMQRPAVRSFEEPVYADVVEEDGPTFDVYPNQHVYMSPEYAYSLNDKEYVIF